MKSSAKLKLPEKMVRKILDLSTAHITNDDSAILDSYADSGADRITKYPSQALVVYPHAEYGYLVSCSQSGCELRDTLQNMSVAGFSKEFIAIFEAAATQGMAYILLDRDAPQCEELPVFDW